MTSWIDILGLTAWETTSWIDILELTAWNRHKEGPGKTDFLGGWTIFSFSRKNRIVDFDLDGDRRKAIQKKYYPCLTFKKRTGNIEKWTFCRTDAIRILPKSSGAAK